MTHEASVGHDLSDGLRKRFDPRERRPTAITSARAVNRFGNLDRASSKPTTEGWMDEDISEEEIGPSALRKAAVPEPEVNEHVRVTTPDEVDGLNRERLITPEEERVPSPLEPRVPTNHLENQGPSVSEQQAPTTPFEARVPTSEQQLPTPIEQQLPHSPVKEPVSPPSKSKLPHPPSSSNSSKMTQETFGADRQW